MTDWIKTRRPLGESRAPCQLHNLCLILITTGSQSLLEIIRWDRGNPRYLKGKSEILQLILFAINSTDDLEELIPVMELF